MWAGAATRIRVYETLAKYRVADEPDGRRLRKVDERRHSATAPTSPQPFVPPLAELDWCAAGRGGLPSDGNKAPLMESGPDAATG